MWSNGGGQQAGVILKWGRFRRCPGGSDARGGGVSYRGRRGEVIMGEIIGEPFVSTATGIRKIFMSNKSQCFRAKNFQELLLSSTWETSSPSMLRDPSLASSPRSGEN